MTSLHTGSGLAKDRSSRPLRVALVAPSLRILGGQSVQAERLLNAWSDDPDVHAWLVPHDPVPPAAIRWARSIKYLRTVVTEATYVPLLWRELKQADVAHVFSASYTSFLLAPLPAIVVARLLGRPVVLNYRSGEAPDHLRRSAIARWALGSVDRNVVPSQFLVDVFARFGIAATIVPNVVLLDRFPYRPRTPLRPRLLSTRNFDALYNVACTLRAFRLVQDRYPDASLTLVGGGPEELRLKALAGSLGLQHVTFVGRVAHDQIARYYADNDLYVQSADIDNMPASVLEAFASGLPVAATEAGGVPTILHHGEHGLLSPIGDHDALAANIVQLLDNQEWARSMAHRAHATLSEFTWERVRERWLQVYRSFRPAVAPGTAPVRA
jgi:glycosyltransferase involved in cell wall biosynthesis